MAEQDDRTVIVEKDHNSSGPIVAIIALIVLVLLALFGLPYFTGGGSTPAPTETVVPTTGQ